MKPVQIILSIIFIFQISFSQSNNDNQIKRYTICNFFENYNLRSGSNDLDFNEKSSKKSVQLAVGLSLLLPGMGELYVGDYRLGKYLTGSEITLWLTYASLNFYGRWIRDDARTFASINANINLSGKDNKYFVNVGNYSDIYQYNEKKLQERKDSQLYDPESHYYWKWNTEENRIKYRRLRIKSDDVLNSTQFVLGAILANHIISAVNAGRLAIKHNSSQNQAFEIKTNVKGTVEYPVLMLTFSKSF